ncbi:immunoglobulin-like domain-containing protein [Aliarcobacter cryaerophilus]|uniref:immunoglobulin-like domain-containing protein n=1 Tax=Aliarcobacter cryaerophilus TaxID=28198 RepID=UPI003DA4FD81
MANLAQIQSIAQGQFFVKDSLGNLVELKVGDTVSLNDTIVAASSNTDLSKIEILFDTNELITLSQGEQLLDATLLASTFGNEELAFDKQEVDETLNAWNNAQDGDATDMETAAGDVTEQATNAGNEEAADGGALRSKFNSRDGDATDIVSDLRDTSFGGGNTEEPQEQIPTELLNPTTTPVTPTTPVDPSIPVDPKVPASKITLTGSEVTEGEKITITATVDNEVKGSDLVITLDNGETITIPVGQTTGKVEYDSRADDVYKQGTESTTVKISETSGGNFEALDTTSTTTVTVKDDEDPTTVTIKGNNVNEGGTATFEIQLSNPPQKGVPLETVIADFTGRNHKQNELINDGWKIEGDGSMAVGNHSGKDGKSERLLIRDQNDGNDNPTTVTSPTFKIVEGDSGKVSFNFYGSNYNSKDNSFTWKVEKLDTKTGKWEVVQEETISKSIGSGGEQLVTTNSLGGGEYRVVYEVKTGEDNKHNKGTENEKSANYGVYIDNVKVTTEKTTGKVQVGDKTYDVVFDEDGKATLKVPVKGNDHYIGEPTLTAKVTEINGGNYEKVDLNTTKNNSKIIVKDTTDTTKVTITAVQTTDKVIDIKNLQNNAGFNVFAKDPYGKEAKISTHGNPSGFGVESKEETTSGKLGQTDKVYSGHTSEIGVVKDETTGKYLSESIEVVFKNPIQTLDVQFAWRHNGERAKVDFYNGNDKVGYAIVKGGGSNTKATVEYYDKNGGLKESLEAPGGTDKVDLVYTFKPAGDVTFTKAVFSADGAGSDYLIHSIKYKEAVGEDNTTVVGSQEVAFKIETSVKPDPIWIAKGNTPTAYVNIVDNAGNEVFKGTVNLDKDGKSIVTVRTDGNVNFTATVTDVEGNFEDVNYAENSVTITGSLLPTASNDSITTNEDTPYTLTKDDFGNIGNTTNTQNVAKIKFDTIPANGTIYVLKTEYTASMNDRAEYTISESNDKVYIKLKAGDIVDISQINKGNVIFVPNKNSDTNGEFKFKVSSGGISDSSFKNVVYTTTIDVKAVADAPVASIDVTKIEIQNTGNSQISTIRTPDNFKQVLNGSDNSGKPNAGHKVEIFSNKTTNSVSISLEIGNPKQLSGEVRFFDINGNHLEGKDVSINESTVKSVNETYEGTFSPADGSSFSSFEVANIGKGSAFHLVGYKYDISGDIADSNAYSFYKVDISSHLTDTDGSETLSVVIKNVPEYAILESTKYDVSKITDNSWSVNFKAGTTVDALLKIEDSLTMKVPQDYTDVDLKIEATSTEKNDNKDSSTTTGTKDSISFGGGGDIDLSNLKNIVNLKEINLDNGKENKLSLTLDDVLKLSGDDGKIKITGDKFDSVTFKKDDGWKKSDPIVDTESGTQVVEWTNTRDESVSVKIEQPISDGITS